MNFSRTIYEAISYAFKLLLLKKKVQRKSKKEGKKSNARAVPHFGNYHVFI